MLCNGTHTDTSRIRKLDYGDGARKLGRLFLTEVHSDTDTLSDTQTKKVRHGCSLLTIYKSFCQKDVIIVYTLNGHLYTVIYYKPKL